MLLSLNLALLVKICQFSQLQPNRRTFTMQTEEQKTARAELTQRKLAARFNAAINKVRAFFSALHAFCSALDNRDDSPDDRPIDARAPGHRAAAPSASYTYTARMLLVACTTMTHLNSAPPLAFI
jgi:hypothetical protein